MKTYLMCVNDRLPKFVAFKIINYIPYEKFKYGPELVKDCEHWERIRGACCAHNRAIIGPINAEDQDSIIYFAAVNEFLPLVYELENTARKEFALSGACRTNNASLVKHLIDLGTIITDTSYINASQVGNVEIIKMLLLAGYNNQQIITRSGYRYNIKFLRDLYPAEKNEGFLEACNGGHLQLIKELSYGVDLETGLRNTLLWDFTNAALFLIDKIGPPARKQLTLACVSLNTTVVRKLLELPGTITNEFNLVCGLRHLKMVQVFCESGPMDLETGIIFAKASGDNNTVEYLKKLINNK